MGYYNQIMIDFFEDFWDHLTEKPEKAIKTKTTFTGGAEIAVRPAYLFAERVDNLLKIIFGLSIAISAFTASFLGFASLSELIDALVSSFWGKRGDVHNRNKLFDYCPLETDAPWK